MKEFYIRYFNEASAFNFHLANPRLSVPEVRSSTLGETTRLHIALSFTVALFVPVSGGRPAGTLPAQVVDIASCFYCESGQLLAFAIAVSFAKTRLLSCTTV